MKLTSPAGLARGASKHAVYDARRLEDAQPTRLGIDAHSTAGWRELGFFTVLPTSDDTTGAQSLLARYLELGRENPLPVNAPLPGELGLALQRPLTCASAPEFDAFADNQPLAGMPYGTAPLGDDAYDTLMGWIRDGATLPTAAHDLPDEIKQQVTEWENFLNQDDLRAQLMSRYIYEHLFLARLHLDNDAPRRFFQLVRSTTPPGEDIDVIATRRPFDTPGDRPFYYRLQVVQETIVHKEHLVYPIGPQRKQRYVDLFLESDWTITDLPDYGESEGGNPFTTFAAIPPKSRYQFLLDDALFFVRSFIRGPVCHGQTAVDVIEDRFWVSFLAPDADLSVTDPSFLQDGATYLELPVTFSESGLSGDLQTFSHKHQVKYLEFRDARYRNSSAHQTGFGYDAIWDGDGHNPHARITVFRHFDNATAITGFHGGIPETAWVIDFPVLERIYYDLVAGFDVFGRVEHQLSTRLYMDELRMESEDLFLNFMPRSIRQDMHRTWYTGTLAEIHTYWHRRRVDDSFPTGIEFATDNPKQEFLLTLLNLGNGLWPERDTINRCSAQTCPDADPTDIVLDLRELANQRGDWVKFLPDLSVLVIEKSDGHSDVFTFTHDKAHYNVAFLFDEEARRDPDADVLSIIPGLIGSYPNFFFNIQETQLPDFVQSLKSIQSQADWMQVVAEFGVRRTSRDFWPLSDKLHKIFEQQDPVQSGVLDLNRYKDPKSGDKPS
ncbi:MAG: fatty acid cis/trans isomerase [Pseudomonadota bacterium]